MTDIERNATAPHIWNGFPAGNSNQWATVSGRARVNTLKISVATPQYPTRVHNSTTSAAARSVRSRTRRPDRRVRRTKHRLKAALLDLIEERGNDRITIEHIAARAEVGRSTFYSHFTSKEDLLFAGFDRWLRTLTEPPPGRTAERRFHFCRPLLEHVATQRRFFHATFVRGTDVRIRRRLTRMLAELVRVELDRLAPRARGATRTAESKRRDGEAHALAGGLLGLVTWWLRDADGMSAEAVDAIFQRMAVCVVETSAPGR